MVSRNTAFDLPRSDSTIPPSRGDRRLINAILRVNLADVESQLGVTNSQLIVVHRELDASHGRQPAPQNDRERFELLGIIALL